MNLNDFAGKIVAKNNFIKASIGGFAGSGKTKTGCSIIVGAYKDLGLKNPILIIDNEKGSRFLIPFFKSYGIDVLTKDTTHLADVLMAMEYLQSGEIDFLFVDSLTKVWYQYLDDYKKRFNKHFLTLQDWGKLLPEWQKAFSDRYVELDGSFIFTGRGGFTYDMEEDENNKKQFVKSGVKVKLAGETPYEPDLNIWMETKQEIDDGTLKQWREAQIMKDRSDSIDGETFVNPTYEDFKPVIDYLMNVEKGEVKGATDTTNLIPREDGFYMKQHKIWLEKIYGELENAYPGTTKEHKIKKSAIKKYIFGTYSETEIDCLKNAQLENGYNSIVDIINDPEGYENMVAEAKKEKDSIKDFNDKMDGGK